MLIELHSVTKYFGRDCAVSAVSLQIPEGQTVAIMGPSGCGKSTLLNLLAGLEVPTSGRVLLGGQALSGLAGAARDRLRLQSIAFVYQFFHLLPSLTLLENVLLPALQAGRFRRATPNAQNLQARARTLLTEVGLGGAEDKYPAEVSGGMMSRAAVVRALLVEPRVLLADEPTGNLDSSAGEHVLELLSQYQRRSGCTLIMVTHSAGAASICDRLIKMKDGKVVAV